MKQIELTSEERLVMENLRLKIQMAEMQKQNATQQLATYTKDLLQRHEIPEGSQVSMTDTHLVVMDPPSEVKPTEEGQKVKSQAEAEAEAKGTDDKAA